MISSFFTKRYTVCRQIP